MQINDSDDIRFKYDWGMMNSTVLKRTPTYFFESCFVHNCNRPGKPWPCEHGKYTTLCENHHMKSENCSECYTAICNDKKSR